MQGSWKTARGGGLWVTSDVYARFGKAESLDRFILREDQKFMIIEKRSQNQWKTGEKLYPAVRKWRLITGSERPTIRVWGEHDWSEFDCTRHRMSVSSCSQTMN
jgi:hypothetical protein